MMPEWIEIILSMGAIMIVAALVIVWIWGN